MERLTYRGTPKMTEDGMITPSYSDYPVRKIIKRLAEYEDAEEQGLLLRLPCKVGDEFWELNEEFVEPAIYPRKAHSLQHVMYCMDRLGKTTFLTCQEAELELANSHMKRLWMKGMGDRICRE